MKPVLMKTNDTVFHQGVEKVKNALIPCILVFLCIPVLSGCGTARYASAPLAPPPPVETALSERQFESAFLEAVYTAEREQTRNYHQPSPAPSVYGPDSMAVLRPELAGLPADLGYERERLSLSTNAAEGDCSLGDRFDRGELLAYEWDRSRLGLDVDGINMKGGDNQAVKLNYTLRLQPEKTQKQRCRYPSAWQGLAGSAYNELMLRKENTVWQQLRQIRKDVQDRF